MNIKEIIQQKPHLAESMRLYEKVLDFQASVFNVYRSPGREDVSYPPELADPVIKALSSSFDIPEESLSSLRDAIRDRRIDFTRIPLGELPSFSLPYHEDELGMIFFLISRPFFFRMGEGSRLKSEAWENGKCTVCGAGPSLASFGESGGRILHCSYCGGSGLFRRLGCPICLTADIAAVNVITAEEEAGYRIDACDACGSYLKTVTGTIFDDPAAPDLADLVSLPLDIIAQGKGYRRLSPNPIGMIRMA